MKKYAALIANSALMAIASVLVATNSLIFNRPETPAELLQK